MQVNITLPPAIELTFLQRIPHGVTSKQGRGAVLFQHGLTDTRYARMIGPVVVREH
jgi:hypothetical protein